MEPLIQLKEELTELQRRLAEVDSRSELRRHSSSGLTEFLLLKLKYIKLKMYQERGHAMPHIHVDYGKKHHVASFSIIPPARLEGSLPREYDIAIADWISTNNEILVKIWMHTKSGGDPSSFIAELEGDK